MPLWLDHLSRFVYCRPLQPNDYICPGFGANGVPQLLTHISSDTVQELLDEFTSQSGMTMMVRHGSLFSTHTLYRGGVQHRFIAVTASKRWSLARVKWWGGWSAAEHVSLSPSSRSGTLTELCEARHTHSVCPRRAAPHGGEPRSRAAARPGTHGKGTVLRYAAACIS